MLKAESKRRRTKAQIQQEKQDAIQKELEINEKLANFDKMQQEYQALQMQAQSNLAAAEILTDLVKKGVLDKDENGIVSVSPQKQNQENF